MLKNKEMIMNIRKIFFTGMFLMLGYSLFSQENLDTYLEVAAQNNPGLKAEFNEYMAAMEKVPQVGALPDPQFAFGYFIQPVETRLGPQEYKFGLSQSFPWFGLLDAKEDVATNLAKARFEQFQNTKSNIFYEVKTAYFNYYFIEKAIEITMDNMEILEVFKRLSLVKIEAGTASTVDELRVELELNDLENQLALFVDTRNTFRVNFNNLLNRERVAEIAVPDTLWQEELPFDKVAMLDEIYKSNHQIKSIEHKLDAFINQEVVARKEGMPKFNVGLDYTIIGKNPMSTVVDNGNDAFMFPSVGITIPIYRKKYKAMVKEAQYFQEAEVNRKEDIKNTLSTIFENIYKEYSDSDRRIDLNEEQADIAKRVLDILISSYSANARDFEEVLRIERQLLRYELEHQRALADKNAAIAFMYYLIGQ
ncbi:outer membrane protein TolC [Gillisia sp. Hel_I_86]|uniref:TolC family protein n=1 Tax=Gillisia sp. Hel_I_86 TaxID=1249981 RepID=UPI00119AF730|nr:TolC family protein [Gillisia sp. Hel_I_86]TVZ26840.1 outer membrane protein TolC [Gillisia sp. Hel_I_86]